MSPKNVIHAFLLLGFLLTLGGVWWAERRHRAVSRYFAEEAAPVSLAVARIVAFLCLLFLAQPYDKILFFSGLPADMRYPPLGLGPVLRHMPISPEIVRALYPVFALACVFGVLGLFTRASAIVATVLGLYLLGIPQYYGKVNHYHHLVWFAALMALSPCADVLSLDAVRLAWRRADAGNTAPPGRARAYGAPIRFLWMLIGVVYFFPGLYKLVQGNLDWLSGHRLQVIMVAKWIDLRWRFPIEFEQFQALLVLGAVGTLVFEMGFFAFLLWRRFRWVSPAMGLSFHNMTFAVMQIGFLSVQPLYLTFPNWDNVFARVGGWMFPKPMVLVYDGTCKICRRTVATLRAFDFLGGIRWIASTEEAALREVGLGRIADDGYLEHFTAAMPDGTEALGYDAYKKIARRIPLLWPLVPFLGLPGISHLGRRIYQKVADSRTCDFRKPQAEPAPKSPAPDPGKTFNLRPLFVVGAGLIAVNCLFGLLGKQQAWPFACYPTFVGAEKPDQVSIVKAEVSDGGPFRTLTLSGDPAVERFGTERWSDLLGRVTGEASQGDGRHLVELWRLYSALSPQARDVREARFFSDAYVIRSYADDRQLVDRTFLGAVRRDPSGGLTFVAPGEAP